MPDPTTSTPSTTTSGPKLRRATQNKLIANYVVAAQTFLRTASTDDEIRPVLEPTATTTRSSPKAQPWRPRPGQVSTSARPQPAGATTRATSST